MQLVNQNMFSSCKDGDALCVTTNGIVRKNGALVMGAGIAKIFRDNFEGVDTRLGVLVSVNGNNVHYIGPAKVNEKTVHLFSFPTKHNWKDNSDLELIRQSCFQLEKAIKKNNITGKVYLPMPGCTNGHLSWDKQVKPIVEMILNSDQFQICHGTFPEEHFQGELLDRQKFAETKEEKLIQKLKEAIAKKETVTENMIQALTPECYEEIVLSCESRFFVLLEDFYVNSYHLDELADMWNEASHEANYTADDMAYMLDRFEQGLESLLRSKVMFQKIKEFSVQHDHSAIQNQIPFTR